MSRASTSGPRRLVASQPPPRSGISNCHLWTPTRRRRFCTSAAVSSHSPGHRRLRAARRRGACRPRTYSSRELPRGERRQAPSPRQEGCRQARLRRRAWLVARPDGEAVRPRRALDDSRRRERDRVDRPKRQADRIHLADHNRVVSGASFGAPMDRALRVDTPMVPRTVCQLQNREEKDQVASLVRRARPHMTGNVSLDRVALAPAAIDDVVANRVSAMASPTQTCRLQRSTLGSSRTSIRSGGDRAAGSSINRGPWNQATATVAGIPPRRWPERAPPRPRPLSASQRKIGFRGRNTALDNGGTKK